MSQNVIKCEAYSCSCWPVTDQDNLEILEGRATCRLHRTEGMTTCRRRRTEGMATCRLRGQTRFWGGGVRSLTNSQRQNDDPYRPLE
jgi:hypothetical protein